MLSPIQISGDFEIAIREACRKIFPQATFCCDLFHFKQANIKRLRQMKGHELVELLSEDLTELYQSRI